MNAEPSQDKKPLSPVIRRSAINNLVGSPNHGSHQYNTSNNTFATTNSQKQALGLNSMDSPMRNAAQSNDEFQHQGSGQHQNQAPDVPYHAHSTKNSQSKKFNMRVGNMSGSTEVMMASKNDVVLQSGPQGGIVGSGIGGRNNGIQSNPLSQRDKLVGRQKDQMI